MYIGAADGISIRRFSVNPLCFWSERAGLPVIGAFRRTHYELALALEIARICVDVDIVALCGRNHGIGTLHSLARFDIDHDDITDSVAADKLLIRDADDVGLDLLVGVTVECVRNRGRISHHVRLLKRLIDVLTIILDKVDIFKNAANSDEWTYSEIKGIITVESPLSIVKQPEDAIAASGEKAIVTVNATGDGLTYKWYYKNKGASKFSYTSTFTGNTYSTAMSDSRDGRQIYCVITDKYGNSVTTDTVTLIMGNTVKIVAQPENVIVPNGKKASVTVNATGDGLTYKWYYKNKGASKFSYTSTFTGNTYSTAMSDSRNGRQIYCVITDKHGNSVTTDTVTIIMGNTVEIVAQPESTVVPEGKKSSVTVSATGDGLTYTWYVCSPTGTKFTKSSITSATYSYAMTADKSGRKVYCVITDKYGNSVKTDTVILSQI